LAVAIAFLLRFSGASIAPDANQLHAVQMTRNVLPGLIALGISTKPCPLHRGHLAVFLACLRTALVAGFFIRLGILWILAA